MVACTALIFATLISGNDRSATSENKGPVGSPAAPANVFFAMLRPDPAATESIGHGVARLELQPGRRSAHITLKATNLTSPVTACELRPGPADGDRIALPAATSFEFNWAETSGNGEDFAALERAARTGKLKLTLASGRHAGGELRGVFAVASSRGGFVPPPPPRWHAPNRPDEKDAARWLMQATFGPTRGEIEDLVRDGTDRWLAEQMALPATSHLAETQADFAAFKPDTPRPRITALNRQNAWWKIAVTAPDQLRQRVAFALSEIFVVSEANGTLADQPAALADYYDLLARDAFGNFRQLLEDVTLSPVMGVYLSHLQNARGDPAKNTSPDENYAREVMQLFTIGLVELQPDGTPRLDVAGQPIPTYDQATVTEMAKVFTGWGYYSVLPKPNFEKAPKNFFHPMMAYPAEHEPGAKTIIGGRKLPGGQDAARDLAVTLDTLFHHPNTGPFFCRQLIQRLVTSNPSPGYVYRVAGIFARNAVGERGDLGAVIRAILTDPEARSPDMADNPGFGKMKEPVLRITALLRAFNGGTASGRLQFRQADEELGQAPLASPSVFNFFAPDHVGPGELEDAGLLGPEFEILTGATAIGIANELHELIYSPDDPGATTVALQLTAPLALADPSRSLVDQLNLLLCAGSMSDPDRARIEKALAAIPPRTTDRDRLRCAVELVATSPAAAIQR